MIPQNNEIRFEITTKCNYNCIICPRDKMTRKIETMNFALFKKLFDKITRETARYNTLTFPGMGEPLLDKNLDKKIEYAKKKMENLSVLILTNGSLLTPKRFKKLENLGVTSVRVSFYGNDQKSYSKIHGVKNGMLFSKVRDNLIKILQIKTTTELLLTFNAVGGSNEDSLEEFIQFWEGRADLVEVWRPHNWVDGRNFRNIQKNKLKTCGRPFKGPLQVQVDGTVNMCCFDFDGKLTVGDLKKESLKRIFSSSFYKKIRDCHKNGRFKGKDLICEHCDQRNKDKSDVMIYNSKFNIDERVKMVSTTYKKVL